VSQCAIEAVRQADEREEQTPLRLATGNFPVALHTAPVVLEVRPRPQVTVALLLQLGPQPVDSLFRNGFRAR
jgi:hypothetical protein